MPTGATSVDLVLSDSGVSQAISLLSGQPAASNIAVTARAHRGASVLAAKAVKVKVTSGKTSGVLAGTMTVESVALTYWSADGTTKTARDRAMLHVMATVKLDGDKQAYGAEPGLVSVTVPGSKAVVSQNVATSPTGVDDVVDVPASVTAGVVTFSGTIHTAAGALTVVTPVSVPFDIPAG